MSPRSLLILLHKIMRGPCDLTSTQRHVLLALADRLDNETASYAVAYGEIAKTTGLAKNTVFRAVAVLAAPPHSYVEIVRRRTSVGDSDVNVFRLNAEKIRAEYAAWAESREGSAAEAPPESSRKGGAAEALPIVGGAAELLPSAAEAPRWCSTITTVVPQKHQGGAAEAPLGQSEGKEVKKGKWRGTRDARAGAGAPLPPALPAVADPWGLAPPGTDPDADPTVGDGPGYMPPEQPTATASTDRPPPDQAPEPGGAAAAVRDSDDAPRAPAGDRTEPATPGPAETPTRSRPLPGAAAATASPVDGEQIFSLTPPSSTPRGAPRAPSPPAPKRRSATKASGEPKAHDRYAEAWARGVASVTGVDPITPVNARQHLITIAKSARDASGNPIVGDELLAWIERTAGEYVRAMTANNYHASRGFVPSLGVEWLAGGRRTQGGAFARAGPVQPAHGYDATKHRNLLDDIQEAT